MKTMPQISVAAVVAGMFGTAWANPTTPTVVSGAALMSNPSASVMQVVNTPGTIINWQGFSIANGETTRFVQQNAASAVLNRVVGANPSSILGRLESNGRVFLINPNGIVFGSSSVVDVAGLIASTRNISDANFLAGNFLFDGSGNGGITMQSGAQILTSTYGAGGQVWLFAKNVTQEAGSTITAPQGQVVLAAGGQVQVAQSQLGNMTFNVNVLGGETIELLGSVAAERGAVGMFADNIRVRDGGTVNVSAGTGGDGGSISAQARTLLEIERLANVAADGGTSDGNGGSISISAADVRVSPVANGYGNVHALARAPGGTHGSVNVTQVQSSSYTQVANVNLPGVSAGPVLAALADGTYIVVWGTAVPSGTGGFVYQNIMSQQFAANGTAMGSPIAISTGSANIGPNNRLILIENDRLSLTVAGLKGGGYVVFWNTHTARETTSGSLGPSQTMKVFVVGPGSSGQVQNVGAEMFGSPQNGGEAVVALTDGGFVASWRSNTNTAYMQRFDASGAPVGAVKDFGEVFASPAALGDGGFLAVGGALGLLRFDASGQLTLSTANSAFYPSGTIGGGYVLFEDNQTALQYYQVNNQAGIRTGAADPSFLFTGAADGTVVGQQETSNLSPTSIAAASSGYAFTYRDRNNRGVYELSVQAKTPAAPSPGGVSAEVGASASFATLPGVAQDSGGTPPSGGGASPAPAPLPAAVGGTGSGAAFAGVSGCNSATCATEVRGALSITDAVRASQNVSAGAQRGRIDDRDAAAAVAALERAQAGGNSAAARAQDEAIAIRDHGEMGRLMADITNSLGNMTPAEVRQQTALLNTIVSDFMERELITQQLGLNRANPDAMDLVGALQNMNAEERAAFGLAIRNSQAGGQP